MGNKELLKEVISQILEAINEQEAVIRKHENHIPQIEIDLIMDNIRKLYENFHALNKVNQGLEEGIRHKAQGISEEEGEGRKEKGEGKIEEGNIEETVEVVVEDEGMQIDDEKEPVIERQVEELEKKESETQALPSGDEGREDVEKNEADTSQAPPSVVEGSEDEGEEEMFIPMGSVSIGFEEKEPVAVEEPEKGGDETEDLTEVKAENIPLVEEEHTQVVELEVKPEDTVEVEPETNPLVESEMSPESKVESKPVVEEKIPEPVPEKKPKPENKTTLDLFADAGPTIADTLPKNGTTIHDTITNGEDNSVAEKMKHVPIQDLKTHIGINDRFLFMNELFLASMQDYDDAINRLNQFGSREEAMEYFNLIKRRYQMNEELDSFKRLKEFVERKYL